MGRSSTAATIERLDVVQPVRSVHVITPKQGLSLTEVKCPVYTREKTHGSISIAVVAESHWESHSIAISNKMSRRDRRDRRQNNDPSDTGSVAPSVGAGSIVSFFTANTAGSGTTSTRDRRMLLHLQDECERLRDEVERERCQRRKDASLHDMELKKLRGQRAAAEKRNEILMRDMDDRNAISHYASLIKKAEPRGAVDSTYVLKLQSQLAKAMHRMGVLENQVSLAEQACEGVVDNLEKEVENIIDRASRVEEEYEEEIKKLRADVKRYKDEMARFKEATSRSEAEFLSQIIKLEDEKAALQKKLDSNQADATDAHKGRRDGRDADGPSSEVLFTSESSESDRSDKISRRSRGSRDPTEEPSALFGMKIEVESKRGARRVGGKSGEKI